ncbi:hypothetical protein [Flavobacterium chilense]|uniref:Uncharacterized protein n=1 Tax=Flavobacterium chilense TaxID=946677 RepID=A0A1M7L2W6_9FLAO|nr:hypothetical protein [Flavobacterium chilense]SHM72374.1 hypothetical protein SAMN05444484_108244 [Flavobacterium chilense]
MKLAYLIIYYMKNEPIQMTVWKGNAVVNFKFNEPNSLLLSIAIGVLAYACLSTKRIA